MAKFIGIADESNGVKMILDEIHRQHPQRLTTCRNHDAGCPLISRTVSA